MPNHKTHTHRFAERALALLLVGALLVPSFPIAAQAEEAVAPPAVDSSGNSSTPPTGEAPSPSTSAAATTPDPSVTAQPQNQDPSTDTNVSPSAETAQPEATPDATDTKKEKTKSSTKSAKSVQTKSATVGGASTGSQSAGQLSLTSSAAAPRVSTQTGALTEHLSLNLPPGRAGLMPNIALDYNSQNPKDGIVGYGWSLSIPYIERMNKTGSERVYSGNYFTSQLDGELSTTSAATKYLPRVDGGEGRVYTFSNDAWTIYDKSGTRYIFGLTAASKESALENASSTYRWMLEQVLDAKGNSINYTYTKEGNQLYPNTIFYTGRGSANPGLLKVVFTKEVRPDPLVRYEGGIKVEIKSRITQVNSFFKNKKVYSYTLIYASGANGYRSLLSRLAETGYDTAGVATTLPPIQFAYTFSTPVYNRRTDIQDPGSPTQYSVQGPSQVVADLNGDSLPDVTTLFQNPNSSNYAGGYINSPSGLQSFQTTNPPEIFAYQAQGENPYSFTESGTRLVDVDGDGKADLVRGEAAVDYPDHTVRTRFMQKLYAGVLGARETSYQGTIPLISDAQYGSYATTKVTTGLWGNINGDAFPDFIRSFQVDYPSAGGQNGLYEGNGSGFDLNTAVFAPVAQIKRLVPDTLVDINGDGLDDWMSTSGSSTSFCLNTGFAWNCDDTRWNLSTSTFWGRNAYDRGFRFIDMNGDGLLDQVRSYDVHPHSLPYGWTDADDVETASVNTVRFNTGSGWATSTLQTPEPITYLNSYSNTFLGDLSYNEMVDWDGNGTPDSAHVLGVGERQDFLKSITYPEGGVSEISYTASAADQSKTNPDLPNFMHAVSKISTSDGSGNVGVINYDYQGGKLYLGNTVDRTFAGFSTVVETRGDRVTTTYYHQGDDANTSLGESLDSYSRIGRPYRVDIANTSGAPLSRTYTRWDEYVRPGTKGVFVVPGQVVEQSFDSQGNHKDSATSFDFDSATGNVKTKIDYGLVNFSPPSTVSDVGSDTYTTTYSYANNAASSISLPATEVTKNITGTTLSESHTYYDGRALGVAVIGNPTKVEQRINDSTFASTTAMFDGYGTPVQTQDAKGNATSYVYDADHMYVASVKNALGQVMSYIYDYSSGQLSSITDPNGEKITYRYDGLGRLVEKDVPDPQTGQTVVQSTQVYVDTPNAGSVHTANYLGASTVNEMYVYKNGLGQVVQQKVESKSGTWSTLDSVYDSVGRLTSVSLPYESNTFAQTPRTSTSALYKTISYDPLDRATTEATAVGTTQKSYGAWQQTVTDPLNNSTTEYQDAYGNLTQVDEHLSGATLSTRYSYERYGGTFHLVGLQDASANTRSFAYDLLGRETRATDLAKPGDSTVSYQNYSYDLAGNRLSMQNPATTVAYVYDALNRLVQENDPNTASVDASYTYDTCSYGVGRLCTQTARSDAQSTSEVRTYAFGGLVKSSAKTIMGKTYTAAYTYDRQGNVLTIQNPDASVITYTYDEGGKPIRVDISEASGAPVPVVTAISYHPSGSLNTLASGNGVATCYTYDGSMLYRLVHIRITAPGFPCAADPKPLNVTSTTTTKYNLLEGLAYTYDADGNVRSVIENAQTPLNRVEAYTYDTLNRLVQTKTKVGTTTQTAVFAYDSLGSLLKIGTTTYQYAVPNGYQNPEAPTSVGGLAYGYNTAGDLTSIGSTTLTYDYADRLTSYVSPKTKSTFLYDTTGARVALTMGTTTVP